MTWQIRWILGGMFALFMHKSSFYMLAFEVTPQKTYVLFANTDKIQTHTRRAQRGRFLTVVY